MFCEVINCIEHGQKQADVWIEMALKIKEKHHFVYNVHHNCTEDAACNYIKRKCIVLRSCNCIVHMSLDLFSSI